MDPDAVAAAEELIEVDPGNRPVYAYVGCLHPALGSVGLIFSQDWFSEAPQGVTKCDSGGLAAGKGSFRHMTETPEKAFSQVNLSASAPWKELHAEEVAAAFQSSLHYLDGTAPALDAIQDVRASCLRLAQDAGDELDRRLWTWEVRALAPIELRHVRYVALAHEAAKRLLNDWPDDQPLPVKLLVGSPGEKSVHLFNEDATFAAFQDVT